VLTAPAASNELWRDVIIDFGHELITAVHTPIEWSDRRPSDEEFRESFAVTRLSAARMLRFVEQRQTSVQRLVLMNSEGYWSGALTLSLPFLLPLGIISSSTTTTQQSFQLIAGMFAPARDALLGRLRSAQLSTLLGKRKT
jgi:hypothetical protein